MATINRMNVLKKLNSHNKIKHINISSIFYKV
jgi:hypothetical protein